MSIFKSIENFFKSKKIIDDYCLFNKRLFNKLPSNKNKGEILVEFNAFSIQHVAYSIISNILSKKFSAIIKAYAGYSMLVSPLYYTFLNEIRWILGNYLNLKNFKIYRSFNTTTIFKPKIDKHIEKESLKIFKKIWPKIKKNEHILNLKLFNVAIGDLLYDTYLKKTSFPTIDIKSDQFKTFFIDFIKLTVFWNNYFKKHNVKAVLASHPVYSYGITLRFAAKKNIEAYVLQSDKFFRITNNKIHHLSDSKDYKKIAKRIDKKILKKGKLNSTKILEQKFSGLNKINMTNKTKILDLLYIQKGSWHNDLLNRKIKKSKKIKVLICTHEFFDAVHLHGNSLFADNYEWLEFLGKISKITNYDWYIKPHRNQLGKYKIYQPYTTKYIKIFNKKYKNIKLLSSEYSHKQIIKEKISFVLTVYGTVALEYPYFNIPVINASTNNPFRDYNFSITPKTKKEYEYILKNLRKIKQKINKEEIREYYYLRFIYNASWNWLINYKDLMNNFKFWSDIFNYNFYKYYMDRFKKDEFNQKIIRYKRFLNSKEYRLRDLD